MASITNSILDQIKLSGGVLESSSVAKATQEPPMSMKDVVILKQGCGYIQKDVVI